jgi:hypothetical protein
MTARDWFSVDYEAFAGYLGFGEEDLQRDRIHSEVVIPLEQMGHLYPPGTVGAAVGKVRGLHLMYRYLDRMFRKTIACKSGDKGSIADYSRNLLVRMVPGTRPFSVFDFIWSEIKSVGERPLKGCGFAPYVTYMIRHVTGFSFECDKEHKVLHIFPSLSEIDTPLLDLTHAPAAGAGAATGAHSPPRAPPQYPPRCMSPICKLFTCIFSMCKDAEVRQRKEREARRTDTRTLKQISERLELHPPRSPISEGEPSSETETEAHKMERYNQLVADFF